MIPRRSVVSCGQSLGLLWALWLATRSAGLLLLTHRVSWYPDVADDVKLYAGYGHLWSHGLMPYRDFHLEYPPGILPLLRLPGAGYVGAFLVCALVADAVAQRSLWGAQSRWGTFLWLVAPLAIGPIFWARLDIFVAALLVSGLIAARNDRWMLGGACLSYAGMLKLWPLGLAVLALVLAPAARRARCFVGVGVVFVALSLPVVVLGGSHGLAWMLRYQNGHSIEIESLPAAPLEFMAVLGHWTPIGYLHGTTEYAPTSTLVQVLSAVFTVLFWLAVVWLVAWVTRGISAQQMTLEAALVGCVGVLFLTSKILSAQYALWALAAVAVGIDLMPHARRPLLAVWTLLLLASTQVMYPFAFPNVPMGNKVALLEGLLHAAVIVGLWTRLIPECRFLSGATVYPDAEGAGGAAGGEPLCKSTVQQV